MFQHNDETVVGLCEQVKDKCNVIYVLSYKSIYAVVNNQVVAELALSEVAGFSDQGATEIKED